MNRRSWFKALGLSAGGAAASAASENVATANSSGLDKDKEDHAKFNRAKYKAMIRHEVDEIIKFHEAVGKLQTCWKFPKANSVPFGTSPCRSTYARVPNEIREATAKPDIKSGIWFSGDLANALWDKIRPSWMALNKDKIEVATMRAEHAKQAELNLPALLPDRISTPTLCLDEAEIDGYLTAAVMGSLFSIRDFIVGRHVACMENLRSEDLASGRAFMDREGDGWVSPVRVSLEFSSFVLKVNFSIICAGMAYSVNRRDAKWLAEQRKSPFHWHKLPFA